MTRKFRRLVAVEGCAALSPYAIYEKLLSYLPVKPRACQVCVSIGAPRIRGARFEAGRDHISSLFGLLGVGLAFRSLRVLGGKSLILFSDLIELPHVLEEIGASLQGDEKLGLLAVSLLSLHSDGSGSDLLEGGIFVSKWYNGQRYYTIQILKVKNESRRQRWLAMNSHDQK